jgi:hypothetical protein
MTQFRTSGAGKLCLEFDFEVWVLLSKGVYCIPISFTLFLSLSVGGVADWRVRFLLDVFLAVDSDVELPHWVEATLAVTWGRGKMVGRREEGGGMREEGGGGRRR